MKGKVIKIVPLGFQEKINMNKWDITIEDERGQAIYSRFSPDEKLNFDVGQEINYETNDRGSMVKVHPVTGSTHQETKDRLGYEPPINKQKQESIVRQSSLQRAHEYCKELLHSNRASKIDPYDVCRLAQYYVDWVESGDLVDVNPLEVKEVEKLNYP